MRVLAIDTVTEMCSVALWVEGEIIDRQQLAANQHSNLVLGMVDAVLSEAGLALIQLDGIINDVGPGSFTGIRIGMGVTQGLAYAADLPVVGVDALSSLAYGVKDSTNNAILAAMDARMGQIYWGCFRKTAEAVVLEGQLQLCDPNSLDKITEPVYGVGSGWDAYADIISEQISVESYLRNRFPLAKDDLKLGLDVPRENWIPAVQLKPVYLRDQVAKVSKKLNI